MSKIWFTIYKYNHGCSGTLYRSRLRAIEDDGWQWWCEERVRRMFNFGNGTMDDFRRYCKDNNCIAVPAKEFWKIAKPLGDKWKKEAEEFINDSIKELGYENL